jgi:hypothetical protein
MAKPINNTPLLKGADAISFLKKLKINGEKKASISTLKNIHQDAKDLRSILK